MAARTRKSTSPAIDPTLLAALCGALGIDPSAIPAQGTDEAATPPAKRAKTNGREYAAPSGAKAKEAASAAMLWRLNAEGYIQIRTRKGAPVNRLQAHDVLSGL